MNPFMHLNPIIFCFLFSYNLESLSLSLSLSPHTQVETNANFLKMIAFASHFGILSMTMASVRASFDVTHF